MTLFMTIKCVMFLLVLGIFLTVTEAHDDTLEITVINENNEQISLMLKETEPFLANNYLPIWKTVAAEYVEYVNVMDEIGEFKTYHDLETSSAVILIENWDCIYGVIDVRYSIVCLPLNELRGYHHIIGQSPYVKIVEDAEWLEHQKPLDLSRTSTPNPGAGSDTFNMLIKTWVNPGGASTSHNRHCTQHEGHKSSGITSDDGPSHSKRPRLHQDYEDRVITVYPELLVFISKEIASTTQQLSTLVLRYLVQFNAVSMLFAKLATHNIKIHINLAGIVVETIDGWFPSTGTSGIFSRTGKTVLASMTDYMISLKNVQWETQGRLFVEDSFDMFLLSTTNAWQEREANPGGISTEVFDLIQNRKRRQYGSKKNYLGSIVDGRKVMQHYVNAAREIAHLMTVKDDPLDNNLCSNGEQCYSIMQVGNRHCPNCLTWSLKSINSFKRYLSVNTNRCFLRNLPRSLHPFDYPIRSLIAADQCLCYGYMPDLEITLPSGTIRNTFCTQTLQCGSPYGSVTTVRDDAIPMDGTPCDSKNEYKVCWNKKCVLALL